LPDLNQDDNMDSKWKGVIISESLEEPSLLNEFDVCKARISKQDELINDDGTRGRWHLYWVYATEKQIDSLSDQIKKGWYAHFWKGEKLIAVFRGKKFDLQANDKSTWKETVEYGKSIGIPEEQLDFPID
jgi:hypothetical protein